MLYLAHVPLTVVAPASFSTPMICSSLNRLLFIGSAPSYRAELHFSHVHFFGVRSRPLTYRFANQPLGAQVTFKPKASVYPAERRDPGEPGDVAQPLAGVEAEQDHRLPFRISHVDHGTQLLNRERAPDTACRFFDPA